MEHDFFVLKRKSEINQKGLIARSALIGFISFHNYWIFFTKNVYKTDI